jgi:transcriptional regulator
MLKAIVGFELTITALRGTRKLGQNKPDAERAGAVAGLRGAGRADMAGLMEAA